MSGAPDPTYVVARTALLDALEALGPHRDALVLVGAQAIYLHTGDAGLAVAEFTSDADVALNPSLIPDDPELSAAMRSKEFYREVTEDGEDVGVWSSRRTINGVPAIVKVDLLVPAAVGGPGRRSARIPHHERGSAKKVSGIEGCLIDCAQKRISSLGPDDERTFEIMVAGPAALLVSKLIKLQERSDEAVTGRDRQKNKDALDVLRLLRAVNPQHMAETLGRLRSTELAGQTTERALKALPGLFAKSDSPASLMAAEAAALVEQRDTIAASCAALTSDLLDVLSKLDSNE